MEWLFLQSPHSLTPKRVSILPQNLLCKFPYPPPKTLPSWDLDGTELGRRMLLLAVPCCSPAYSEVGAGCPGFLLRGRGLDGFSTPS